MWLRRPREASVATRGASHVHDGIDALISLAQTQLLAQMLDSDSADARSMGVLGLNGAMAAADLAARGVFGGRWWMPLPGIALSTAALLGLGLRLRLELGPSPHAVYEAYSGQPRIRLGVQLLSDLDDALRRNDQALIRKRRRLAFAVAFAVTTIVYSTAAFA